MTKPSESQKNYIRTVRRRRRTVQFMRLFLFLFFVILWEVAAEFSWIDSFIFSSPLRIAKTAWQMLQDGSLTDRKSTRLNSSHWNKSRMPSSA